MNTANTALDRYLSSVLRRHSIRRSPFSSPNCESPGALAQGLSTYSDSETSRGAGDGSRTRDVQLGKLAFYP